MRGQEKKVIFASSLGTVFEWYDFFLYGSLAAIIAKQFFAGLDPTPSSSPRSLAFAAGFLVRPFGALVFGSLGDRIGRKYTFLVTILIMGISTFLVGVTYGADRTRRRGDPGGARVCCKPGAGRGGTAAPRPTSPNTPRTAAAASTPRGSRPLRPWACSCRCW
ncbi:sugar transporter domain-containing protein [Ditylenchus destructor]|nr:sugar transporter domain-containing protein [Ditylenchus destructor]